MNANTIKAARAGLDWTQARLAAEAGLHPKSVAHWERMPGDLPEAANGAPRKIREAFARHGVAIEGHVVRFHRIGTPESRSKGVWPQSSAAPQSQSSLSD